MTPSPLASGTVPVFALQGAVSSTSLKALWVGTRSSVSDAYDDTSMTSHPTNLRGGRSRPPSCLLPNPSRPLAPEGKRTPCEWLRFGAP